MIRAATRSMDEDYHGRAMRGEDRQTAGKGHMKVGSRSSRASISSTPSSSSSPTASALSIAAARKSAASNAAHLTRRLARLHSKSSERLSKQTVEQAGMMRAKREAYLRQLLQREQEEQLSDAEMEALVDDDDRPYANGTTRRPSALSSSAIVRSRSQSRPRRGSSASSTSSTSRSKSRERLALSSSPLLSPSFASPPPDPHSSPHPRAPPLSAYRSSSNSSMDWSTHHAHIPSDSYYSHHSRSARGERTHHDDGNDRFDRARHSSLIPDVTPSRHLHTVRQFQRDDEVLDRSATSRASRSAWERSLRSPYAGDQAGRGSKPHPDHDRNSSRSSISGAAFQSSPTRLVASPHDPEASAKLYGAYSHPAFDSFSVYSPARARMLRSVGMELGDEPGRSREVAWKNSSIDSGHVDRARNSRFEHHPTSSPSYSSTRSSMSILSQPTPPVTMYVPPASSSASSSSTSNHGHRPVYGHNDMNTTRDTHRHNLANGNAHGSHHHDDMVTAIPSRVGNASPFTYADGSAARAALEATRAKARAQQHEQIQRNHEQKQQ